MKILSVIILLLLMAPCAVGQLKVTAIKKKSKIDVLIEGRLFTSYIFSKDEKYPFFFPVNGPSAAGVTSIRNANYPHHSSLFFGCDKVNGGNYWQEGLDRGQIISLGPSIKIADGNRVVIKDECIWTRPDAYAPMKDKREIIITAPEKNIYQLDFAITLEMLMNVQILKTNHSLFSARMDPDLAVINGGTMINAEGMQGEKETFAKKSVWIDYSGNRGTGKEGLAIFQHPDSKWFPAPWFTRDYGFISPTPMYWPEDEKGISLKKGDTIDLFYRVIVHSGDHQTANIKELYQSYSSLQMNPVD